MGQTPPLDELSARKRLVQAKMELHRAEIALYYQEVMMPLRTVQSGFQQFKTHPIYQILTIAGMGFLFFSNRLRSLGKIAGFVIPIAIPQLRRFFTGNLSQVFFKSAQSWFSRGRS